MKPKLLNEGRILDAFIVYMIAKKFITPFKKWRAFELGLIDEKGKRTKKKVTTSEEKDSYTLLDRMIRKIRVFVGDKWFLKLTLAYLLLKEEISFKESRNFKLLQENSEKSQYKTVQIGALESVSFYYDEGLDNIEIYVESNIKDPTTGNIYVTSSFGGFIPKKNRQDEVFISVLNFAFSNLLNGGIKEYIITDINGTGIPFKISYSSKEIKMDSTTSESGLDLGKFYLMFNNRTEVTRFMDTWSNFYQSIIYS